MNEENGLPSGWVNAKLQDIAPLGGTRNPKANGKGEFFYVDIEAVDNTVQKIVDPKRLSNSEAPSRARMAIQFGDVIFSMVRPYLKNIAIVPIELDGQVASTAYCVMQPASGVVSSFVFYSLLRESFINSITTYGNSPPSAHDDEFLAMSIPFAPTNEQQRIVAAIEQQFSRLDAGVAALRRAQAKLKRYRAAVLRAAVEGKLTETWRAEHPTTEPASQLLERILAERREKWEADLRAKGKDPAKARYLEPAKPDVENLPELPEGWCWATVEQLITYLRNGLPQMPSNSPPGYRILRINAVRPMRVDLDEVRYLQLPEHDVEGYFLEDGDILFTRYNGSLELLGVAGVVRSCSIPTLHPDKLIRVKTVLAESLPSYLELASNTGASRAHIESRARTTAGQKGISGSDIKQMPIPLPPLDEQEQIVAEVERRLSIVSQLEATVEANLKRAERLRQSILKEAFAGRLVPQDPSDEPASVLLERIRGEREKRKHGVPDNGCEVICEVAKPEKIDVKGTKQVELWESITVPAMDGVIYEQGI